MFAPAQFSPDTALGIRSIWDELERGNLAVLDVYSRPERELILNIIQELKEKAHSPLLASTWEEDYETKPVDIDTFIESDDYMGMRDDIWPIWRDELRYVCDPANDIREWIIEGAIGTGKTTAAVVAQLYKIYSLTMIRNPQHMFGLTPDTQIAIILFNITIRLSDSVAFHRIRETMQRSRYFKRIMTRHPNARYGKLPKNLVFTVGSTATHALGQAVYGGLLDEANFSKMGAAGPVIQETYKEVRGRIVSRFHGKGGPRGLLCLLSQKRDESAWLTTHRREHEGEANVHVSDYSLWDVREDLKKERRFYVVVGSQTRRSSMHKRKPQSVPEDCQLICPPVSLWPLFESDLEGSIRDIGGVSTYGYNSYIYRRDRIQGCVSEVRQNPFTHPTVLLGTDDDKNNLILDFKRNEVFVLRDKVRDRWAVRDHPMSLRFIHVDLALNNDAAGIACCCLSDVSTVTRYDQYGHKYDTRDYRVHVDFVARVVNTQYAEIDYDRIIEFIHYLRDSGLPIQLVTYDGFQSAHSLQKLAKEGFNTSLQSVDRTMDPYETLKQAILELRIEYPKHDVLLDELSSLERFFTGNLKKVKVDHPPTKSKDVSDALCGCVFSALNSPEAAAALKPSAVPTVQVSGPDPGLIEERPDPVVGQLQEVFSGQN